MLQKILGGEYGLGKTFWKFGILGILLLHFFVRIFDFLLVKQIGNISLKDYYFHYFKPMDLNVGIIFCSLCYWGLIAFMAYYSLVVWLGIVRTSEKFERSAVLVFIIKVLILLFIAINFWTII